MTPYLIYLLGLASYGAINAWQYKDFQEARNRIDWRIHVNGIRGKSTVTRYVAAIFRQAGYRTYGKTTGSAARILMPDGSDQDIHRRGLPNVNEQVRIMRQFSREGAEAAVMECMAVNPIYAEWLEQRVMCSNLGILTNIRLDHTDYLGTTLPEIANSLARSIPRDGYFISAEEDPELQEILRLEAKIRGTELTIANASDVTSESLAGFNHYAIEANVAIGYLVADRIGLLRQEALLAMQTATPDPGAFRLQHFKQNSQPTTWVNLFAVNDRESFVVLCKRLFAQYPEFERVVILNNRLDRQARVELFAQLAAELEFDLIVTFGDYEAEVNRILTHHHHPIMNLGNRSDYRHASGKALLRTILEGTTHNKPVLLIGTVNIHTPQAERLLAALENEIPCI